MSTLVICLGVVGATFAVLKFAVEPPDGATDEPRSGRGTPPSAPEVVETAVVAAAVAESTVAIVDSAPPVEAPSEPRRPRHLKVDSDLDDLDDLDDDELVGDVDLLALALYDKPREDLSPPMGPPEEVKVKPAERLRSAMLLAALLTALGAFAALTIGLVIVALVTGLRSAIG